MRYTYKIAAILLAVAAAVSCRQKDLWWDARDAVYVDVVYDWSGSIHDRGAGTSMTLYLESNSQEDQYNVQTGLNTYSDTLFYELRPYRALAVAIEPKSNGEAQAIVTSGSSYADLVATTTALQVEEGLDTVLKGVPSGAMDRVVKAPEMMWSGHRDEIQLELRNADEPRQSIDIPMQERVYQYRFTLENVKNEENPVGASVSYLREVWGFVSGLAPGVDLDKDSGRGGVLDGDSVTMQFKFDTPSSSGNVITGTLTTFGPIRGVVENYLTLYGITNAGTYVTLNGDSSSLRITNSLRSNNEGYADTQLPSILVSLQRPIGDPDTGGFIPDIDPWEPGDDPDDIIIR